jgi:hypothetical protein
MNSRNGNARVLLLLAAAFTLLTLNGVARAQVQTQTNTTSGQPAHQVTVERGEVVYVSGNDLVVKMEDGSLRNFENVPESARVTVGGRELGIHELKPGMKLERTITVTTTPKTITTTKTVTGKVWHVTPPNSVILTLEDGSNEKFTIPKGQKFNVNGEMTDAWGLKKGMSVSATKVVEEPITVVEQRHQLTGTMPPPPPPPAPDQPILIAVVIPNPTPAAETSPAPELPKTGSMLPLIGLLGCFATLGSLGLRSVRKTL